MQAMEKTISDADDMMDRMSVHHIEWKSKMKQARMALQTVLADALLTAGYVVYCGPLEQPVRTSLLSDWIAQCETTNFSSEIAVSSDGLLPVSSTQHLLVPNENYSVEEVIGVAELLETSEMLADDDSRCAVTLLYSSLHFHSRTQRCTLLVDPDTRAESCIRFILEHVSPGGHESATGESFHLLSCLSGWLAA